ncbi:fimbrial protein [Halomonas sp. V046]|uniref:fimbrial protein n=1 Tax=Halomonas sp. V046 TaxID=3459611 RepID=UPI004044D024
MAARRRSAAIVCAVMVMALGFASSARVMGAGSHCTSSPGAVQVTLSSANIGADAVGTEFGGHYGASHAFDCYVPANRAGQVVIKVGTALSGATHSGTHYDFATNLAGISLRLRITSIGANTGFYSNGFEVRPKAGNTKVVWSYDWTLVKSAETAQGGRLDARTLIASIGWVDLGATGFSVFHNASLSYGGGDRVTLNSCSLETPALAVDMGEISIGDLSGVGSTGQGSLTTITMNCPSGTAMPIGFSIDAANSAEAIDRSQGIVGLSQGATASGIGYQVSDPLTDQPIVFGHEVVRTKASAAMSFGIPLRIRPYQTQAAITAGSADASLVFTISYR